MLMYVKLSFFVGRTTDLFPFTGSPMARNFNFKSATVHLESAPCCTIVGQSKPDASSDCDVVVDVVVFRLRLLDGTFSGWTDSGSKDSN